MVYQIVKLVWIAVFAIGLTFFGTTTFAQDATTPEQPASPLAANPGQGATPAEQSAVVFCVLPDYGAQKIFYAPLHVFPSVSPNRLSHLSLRFIRSVNAQHQLALDVNQKACGQSPTTLAASSALTRVMSPLLSQGFVAVEIGIF